LLPSRRQCLGEDPKVKNNPTEWQERRLQHRRVAQQRPPVLFTQVNAQDFEGAVPSSFPLFESPHVVPKGEEGDEVEVGVGVVEVFLAVDQRLEDAVDVLYGRTGPLDPLQQGVHLLAPRLQESIPFNPEDEFLLGAIQGWAEGAALHTFDFVLQSPTAGHGAQDHLFQLWIVEIGVQVCQKGRQLLVQPVKVEQEMGLMVVQMADERSPSAGT